MRPDETGGPSGGQPRWLSLQIREKAPEASAKPAKGTKANARFSDFTEEARRLYTAHKLTLYARVALPDGVTPSKSAIAAAGQAQQKIASKKVGEVSVTYASGTSSSSVSARTDLADLPETSFGLQLLSLLKMYGGSFYVP